MAHKETIEDYVLGEQLGHGQFAHVRLAQHKSTKELYAIKIIDLSKMSDKLGNESMVQQRVLNEVNIHCDRGLRHSSIVRCFSVFADGRNVYLVLEFCNMGTLKSYVENKKRLSEKEARTILNQILDGLMVLHTNKVMHRDISMGNILLNRDNRNTLQTKIGDFGLAERLESPDMKHFTMCGTPNYMSPEVASGTGHGLETDIFSLGSVLYTMLVGGPPFESSNVQDTINNIKGVLYKMPNLLSAKAQHLIMSVMRLNPVDRLTLNEIRDHPFLTGGSLDDFKSKYPKRNPCTEWSMDSGRGTTVSTLSSVRHLGVNSNSATSNAVHSTPSGEQQVLKQHPGSSRSLHRNTVSPHFQVPHLRQQQLSTPGPDAQVSDDLQFSADNCYYNSQEDSGTSSSKPQHVTRLPQQSQSMNSSVSSGNRMQTQSHNSNGASKLSQQESDSRRVTPVLPRRMDKNRQLVEFMSNTDGGNISSSSMSDNSSLQTPLISRSSKDSSLSDDMRNLPAGQFASSDLDVDNDTCSVKSMPGGGGGTHLAHCSSETNLAATLPPPHSHRRSNVELQQAFDVKASAIEHIEHAQQLRRRSRSADNMSRRNQQKKQDTWSAVEIDIVGQQSAKNDTAKFVSEKPRSKSELGQRIVEGVPPAFNAIRLRPFRQQMNSVVYTILEEGQVCMEFFRDVNGVPTVVEVMYMSIDGLQIKIYKPNGGKGCMLGTSPPPLPPAESVHLKHFAHETLPKKLWRKYSYASLFVSNIKAKTPKITLYTKRAKFQLMENSDVEVTFYNGAKYHKAGDSVRVILSDGTMKHLETSSSVQELSEEGQELCQYVAEMLQICTNLCNMLASLQAHCGRGPDLSLFPMVIGRRPTVPIDVASMKSVSSASAANNKPDIHASIATGPDQPSSAVSARLGNSETVSRVPSVGVSIASWTQATGGIKPALSRPSSARSMQSQRSVRSHSQGQSVPPSNPALQTDQQSVRSQSRTDVRLMQSGAVAHSVDNSNSPVCVIDVPGIGRASRYANGAVWIHYGDGSQLGVKATSPKYVIDVNSDGQSSTYYADDELPKLVCSRIANDLPVAMEQLKMIRTT